MTIKEAKKVKKGDKVKFKESNLVFTVKTIKEDVKGLRFGFEEMNISPLHKKLEIVED